ncbi:MAG: DUF302 domain-containing protein [Nitrospirae bacterium]|nr:MAG: DUF302 domain-containing protein [Nitrospirota bacterium]
MAKIANYGIRTTVKLPVAEAVPKVVAALKEEGFGVLTEIDVAATLKEKLGEEMPPYRILGACNPKIAHASLQAERELGLLLPCNVIVYEDAETGETVVSAVDPERMLSIVDNPELAANATEVKAMLQRAIDRL